MQRSFYEIVDERRRAGATVFFSSHVLSEVERVCDRVAIVRRGQLVALSDVGELLARRRRHVEIRFAGPPPSLAGIPGISDVQVRDEILTAQLEGDPGPFVSAIAGTPMRDLTIEPARLEDAFMEFYGVDADELGEAPSDDGSARELPIDGADA
jgi:ABC-2 type transport system ATP-binding protein